MHAHLAYALTATARPAAHCVGMCRKVRLPGTHASAQAQLAQQHAPSVMTRTFLQLKHCA